MQSLPKKGDRVRLVNADLDCKINKALGDGAQGKVYKAKYGNKNIALKWYKPSKADDTQKDIITKLIDEKAPCERFLWPIDLAVSDGIKGFGYIMELKEDGYKSISDLVARKVGTNFNALCTAAYELTDSFKKLHAKGFCYRDINFDNIFFDPLNGDIQICDNDNIGINNKSKANVLGTQRFMAPEVVRGEKMPNRDTDKYSLAVLLFYIFINDHPLHGKKESKIKCFDLPAMKKIYGEDPVFIYDPNDKSNRPVAGEHDNAINLWPIYPQFLKDLFIQTFTEGLNDINNRVTEGQWRKGMLRLRDCIVNCFNCGKENFYDAQNMDSKPAGKCWSCGQELKLPYRIKFDDNDKKIVVLNGDTKLYPHHIDKTKKRNFDKAVAEIAQHPKKPSVWGLKNLTKDTWSVTTTNGNNHEVVPGKSAILETGVKIDFGNVESEIIY